MTRVTRWLPLLVLLSGCDLPGKPKLANKFVPPSEVLDFAKLYAKNCAGCHGKNGNLGPAPPLNDPVFLAIAPQEELAKVIAGGRSGTEMPAFALDRGGTLTAKQVRVLVAGLRQQWGQAKTAPNTWPDYLLPVEKGNAERGKIAFDRVCAACHGQNGYKDSTVGPINDPAFLALASEQALRRIVITGRGDLGMPNCAEHDGGALTAVEINDLVALMMSWKQKGMQ